MTHEFKVGDIVQLKPKYAAESPYVRDTVCVISKVLYEYNKVHLKAQIGAFYCSPPSLELSKSTHMIEHASQSPRDKISRILMNSIAVRSKELVND